MELVHQNLQRYTQYLQKVNDRSIKLSTLPNHVQFQVIPQEWRESALLQLYNMSKDDGSFAATIFFGAVYLYDYTMSKMTRQINAHEHSSLVTAAYLLTRKYESGDLFHQSLAPTILGAEYLIFQTLEFNLIVPNMMLILRLISWELSDGCDRTRTAARILMTCALFDRSYVKYSALQIATACMIIACKSKGKPTALIEEFCDYHDNNSLDVHLKSSFIKYKGHYVIKDLEASRQVIGTVIQLEDYFMRHQS